jgi:hypothetical protein
MNWKRLNTNDCAKRDELIIAVGEKGGRHGQVRQKGTAKSQEGDARAQKRHFEERSLGKNGQEPQASDRHRALGSSTCRRESAAAKIEKEINLESGGSVTGPQRE